MDPPPPPEELPLRVGAEVGKLQLVFGQRLIEAGERMLYLFFQLFLFYNRLFVRLIQHIKVFLKLNCLVCRLFHMLHFFF